MGLSYYPAATAPAPGSIVWCRWPSAPHLPVRPVLVRRNEIRRDRQNVDFAVLTVFYGTGELQKHSRGLDLFIETRADCQAAGLHKPTVFCLRDGNKKLLVWCSDYFVGQTYWAGAPVVAGALAPLQRDELRACLAKRGR